MDNVYKQAIVHFLLTGENSLLALFSPVYISRLPLELLQGVAGEARTVKDSRVRLNKEVGSLTKAIRHL